MRPTLCAIWRGALVVIALGTACTTGAARRDGAVDAAVMPADQTMEASAVNDAQPRADASVGDSPGDALRVLFVGNSLTYVNDLPGVVHALGAATPGAAVDVDSVVMGGATLLDHWSSTGAPQRIATGGFDTVVLQGQSAETLDDPSGFSDGARLLGGAVRDAGARTVWYATWAFGPDGPTAMSLGAVGDPTRQIEHAYEAAALANGGVVARVGAAWQLAIAELPGVVLHSSDNVHPTPEGTLLAACVMLRTLTGRTPRVPDPPPLGIARDTANALCAIAGRVQCDEGRFVCGDACVDLQSDFTHCGRCGVACAGEDPCIAGRCGCPTGYTPCARTTCAFLPLDPANCGGCGVRCSTGGVCADGSCQCPGVRTYRVTDPALTPLPPACATIGAVPTADCNTALYERCRALSCYTSGFGPTLVGGIGPAEVCVAGDVRATTYTALQALVPACDGRGERIGPNCSAAIHRYCVSIGAASGFGPADSLGDDVTVTCLPHATVVHTTFATLTSESNGWCDGVAERWGFECGWGSSFHCQHTGHLTGFGPVEATGDDVDIVCVDP